MNNGRLSVPVLFWLAVSEVVEIGFKKTPGDRYENWANFALDLATAGRLSQ